MPTEVFYVTPRPTYFVTLSGTSSATPFTIPDRNRRLHDSEENKLVRVEIQNVETVSSTAVIAVIDENNLPCMRIYQNTEPREIVTDSKLKIITATGYNDAAFLVMAFYERPLDR
jgi:hypothetical protein